MSIKHAILGFLSWTPLTGYELKKKFEESMTLHWSGNNNQIYKALVELHKEESVTCEVFYEGEHPPRKVYTVTDKGMAELREWVLSTPEAPQRKHSFLVQLAWADHLEADQLDHLLGMYEEEVGMQVLMLRAQKQKTHLFPRRTPRETYIWDMILENWISSYENELNWVRNVRKTVGELEG